MERLVARYVAKSKSGKSYLINEIQSGTEPGRLELQDGTAVIRVSERLLQVDGQAEILRVI